MTEDQNPPVVLLLDDDEVAIAFMKAIFAKLKLKLLAASEPIHFIELFKKENPQLCLIDLYVGRVGVGFALIQAIRNIDANIPLFVVSGLSDSEAITHAMGIGATDFIIKPVDKELLSSKMAKVIQSNALSEAMLKEFKVPQMEQVQFEQDFEALQIDELGVTIQTPVLLLKGAKVSLTWFLLEEIFGQNTLDFSVSSTWITSGGTKYGAYLEFDFTFNNPKNLRRLISRWIAVKIPK